MTRYQIAVVSAGVRTPSSTHRLAEGLGAAVHHALESAGVEAQVTHLEVRDLGHDLVDALLTGVRRPRLQEALDVVAAADALVAVTPTFAASYTGLFKVFVDTLDRDVLRGRPVLLAATGGSQRHALMIDHAMRPLFASLGALAVPTGVYAVPSGAGELPAAALVRRVDRAGRELARAVQAVRASRRSLHLVPERASSAHGGRGQALTAASVHEMQ